MTVKLSVHTEILLYLFYIMSEMDILSPWGYLHAGVAAAWLSLSVSRFFKQHKNL